MHMYEITPDNRKRLRGVMIVTTESSLKQLTAEMQERGAESEVFVRALSNWPHLLPCPYAVICDTEKGGGVSYADCVECAKKCIGDMVGHMHTSRLRSVGYSVLVPSAEPDYLVLQTCVAEHALLCEEGGHA